jgi:signal transduction histidine kinase
MNQPETVKVPEAAQAVSDLQKELAEVLLQRAAISAVLRAIASSPHDLQPVFDTIIDNARRLSRADSGVFRLVEEAGFRLVARAVNPAVSEETLPSKLVERGTFHGSFYDRLIASKSPLHVPDVAPYELRRLEEALALTPVERGFRTLLFVPMLRNDELIGSLALARLRVEHFTEKEIELLTDFAAQANIALEIVRRERQYRQLQAELAHANRASTLGQLSASIVHEVKQPIAATVTNAQAALRLLGGQRMDLVEARQCLKDIVKDGNRASEVISRMHDLFKKAPPRRDVWEINGAISEVIELTHGEAVENSVSVRSELADGLPLVQGDRVQLQQVSLNLIVNAIQAMSGLTEGIRELHIGTESAGEEGRARRSAGHRPGAECGEPSTSVRTVLYD